MGRIRSLNQQMRFVIDNHKAFGESKRSEKFNNSEIKLKKIYSYNSNKNLNDFSKSFSNFMQNNHPEIRRIVDVKSEHVKEYLTAGKDAGWTAATYNSKVSLASKMGILVADQYGRGGEWTKGIAFLQKQPKMRSVTMKKADVARVIQSAYFSKSEGAWGARLAEAFGLRVSESVSLKISDFDLQTGTLHVRGKGGRDRWIPIRSAHQWEEARDFLSFAEKKGVGTERILSVKAPAVNAFIRRVFEKEGITIYRDAKTSVHAIRKLFAQDRYVMVCAAAGVPARMPDGTWIYHAPQWDAVAAELGHGRNRADLFKAYVAESAVQ